MILIEKKLEERIVFHSESARVFPDSTDSIVFVALFSCYRYAGVYEGSRCYFNIGTYRLL